MMGKKLHSRNMLRVVVELMTLLSQEPVSLSYLIKKGNLNSDRMHRYLNALIKTEMAVEVKYTKKYRLTIYGKDFLLMMFKFEKNFKRKNVKRRR